ncbi:RimK family protein [Marinagarivorans algicola]|uniref:RimK family protein n=1 Tax=Marinagarivorans algicola TaxID=1513270 RepID=UPI0006B6070D|nr:RimK family protein [Marinagarivorans algicola]
MFKTLIVVDDNSHYAQLNAAFISFEQYLSDYPKLNEPKTRIINLCNTQQYLSKGYYCSLLAEARKHVALPSVKTINRLRDEKDNQAFSLIPYFPKNVVVTHTPQTVLAFFGQCRDVRFQALCQKAFKQFSAPILGITFFKQDNEIQLKITQEAFTELNPEDQTRALEQVDRFTQTVWRTYQGKKQNRWDLAILVNPQEENPPSDSGAIKRFIKAAAKHGITAQTVTAEQLDNINRYDALFIRETTAIDHHTYRLACNAEKEGLVVLDDPVSILRCCNKVFLHDAFSYQKVPSLKTEIISDNSDKTLLFLESKFDYPMILKMPEGSFSRGVFKVKTQQELKEKLAQLLADSALVLAQEYLYTDYDWRIGILGGRALYASRYLMARNHWQIYNHSSKRFSAGGFETLPTFEVPKVVLDAALKAAKTIGNSLYGVDVKQVGDKAYVLEVNDNPNIDHKIEDVYLGDELYMQIMAEFQRRLEARGR